MIHQTWHPTAVGARAIPPASARQDLSIARDTRWDMRSREEYMAKLRDPRWQQKRLRIFERDEWKCRICGTPDRTLHVHHVAYDPDGREPWDDPDALLVTACDVCHELEHGFQRTLMYALVELLADCGICTSIDLFRIVEKVGPTAEKMTTEQGEHMRARITAVALGVAIQDWPDDQQKAVEGGWYYARREHTEKGADEEP